MTVAQLSRATESLYNAAAGLQDWPSALHELARSFGAVGAVVFPHDADDAANGIPASTDLTDTSAAYTREEWWARDYRMLNAGPLARRTFAVEQEISCAEIRDRHPYYRFMRDHGLLWWSGSGITIDGRLWTLAFHRSPEQQPFDLEDGKPLTQLHPAISTAFTLAKRLDRAAGAAQIAFLERLSCAAALIDESGIVVQLNARADGLIGADLTIRCGHLTAAERLSDEKLQALIRAARQRGGLAERPILPPVTIAQRGKRPLLVQILPVVGGAADLFGRGHAILTFIEPGTKQNPPDALLQSLFGLTKAETRLAISIARGESLEDAAAAFGISRGTAAQQLKTVFGKTETHRQAELTALLAPLALVAR